MSQYKHKMVNGELVELTAQEIEELERRDVQTLPEQLPETETEPRTPHAPRRTR